MAQIRKRGRKANDPGKVTGQVQTLSRGLLLLERLAEAKDGANLSDISQQVGLALSTTHRLLNTLEQNGYLYQNKELGRWYIGVKAFTIGNTFLQSRDIVTLARPNLHELMENVGETTNLAVLIEDEAIFLVQAECHEKMRMVVPLGSRVPLHASGVGKALLANMTKPEVSAILQKKGLAKYTENTIVEPKQLFQALTEVKEQGFAFDDEEHAVGLRCVAACVVDEYGQSVAAISVSGPRARIPDDRISYLGHMVVTMASRITRQYGGNS
ncbi:MAG: helix-turn-helix domain-containing protein [SAR324 cluster bacterium]|nr:helix-turn-helix domain-containing protein [SAR324 cluster bacterium]